MPRNEQGQWEPGTSGNPHGRPPKSRALTDLLEKAGNRTIEDVDQKKRAYKRVLARMLWEFVSTGQATLPCGEIIKAEDAGDWMAAVKFLYAQIDGPPPKEIDFQGDMTLHGGLTVNIGPEPGPGPGADL